MAKILLEITADSSELTKATDDINDFSKAAVKAGNDQKKAFKQGADATKEAHDAMSDFAGEINFAGVNIGNVTSKFGSFKTGIGSIIKSFGVLRTAIIATGIGALLIAITGLISLFTKTEKGAEKLERVFSGIGAAVDAVIGRLAIIGEGLMDIFNGDFSKGADAIANSFNGIAHEINNAYTEASNLQKIMQELEDTERANALTISKNQTLIDKLLVQSKNRALSEKERIALLDQAAKIEQSNLFIEQDAANIRISNIEQENELKRKAGTLRDEDEDKLKDAILRRDELERSSLVLQEKIINRKEALNQEFQSAEKQRLDDKAALAEKDAKALEKQTADRKKQLEDFKKLSEQELANTLRLLDIETNQEITAVNERLAQRKITEDQANQEIAALKLAALNKQLKDLQDYAVTVEDTDKAIAEKRIEIANFIADGKIAANEKTKASDLALLALEQTNTQLKLDLANTYVQGFATLLSQNEADREKFGKVLKTLAIAEIAINLAKELSAIQAAAAANPANAVTAGVAGVTQSTLLSALAITKAGFATATVLSQQFYKGGYTGDGGKYDFAGNVHKGEFVHDKEKTAKHRNLFEAIHRDDYSILSSTDLDPILKGTGVVLKEDVPVKINKTYANFKQSEYLNNSSSAKRLESIERKMEKYFSYQFEKAETTVLPNGSIKTKKGNTIKIVRKKND